MSKLRFGWVGFASLFMTAAKSSPFIEIIFLISKRVPVSIRSLFPELCIVTSTNCESEERFPLIPLTSWMASWSDSLPAR